MVLKEYNGCLLACPVFTCWTGKDVKQYPRTMAGYDFFFPNHSKVCFLGVFCGSKTLLKWRMIRSFFFIPFGYPVFLFSCLFFKLEQI